MSGNEIFLPMLGVMTLTAAVWFYMYSRRISAMRKRRVPVQAYTTPAKVVELLPEEVNYPANNLKNLFELPVLFYALCLYLNVSSSVDTIYLIAAWLFFAFRVFHSVVHCTRNIVMVRFYTYASAAIALWFMVFRAAINALANYL